MEFKLKEAAVCADREFEMIKITPEVRAFVEESGIENGLVYVITEHTTTGITVNESLDCVEKDIMEFDQAKYDKVLDEFHEKVGLVFDGRASEKLAENINNFLK